MELVLDGVKFPVKQLLLSVYLDPTDFFVSPSRSWKYGDIEIEERQ